jgi:hypothetical protein
VGGSASGLMLSLMEYDLAYESLKSIKGQVVVDFIIEHSIDENSNESCNLVSIHT